MEMQSAFLRLLILPQRVITRLNYLANQFFKVQEQVGTQWGCIISILCRQMRIIILHAWMGEKEYGSGIHCFDEVILK
ncbi:MAG: hypothetical protein CVV31_12640 [Methanomicrobiales archaeon HGW-Methanomicrobiales-2]|nr:MAG: hypothetical protein CVV31_12640 [Methanomicrobiales archaeon HGW-Methanomicrobiales-2]